jgi:hypothetical protein
MAKPLSDLRDISGRNITATLTSRTTFKMTIDDAVILSVIGDNLHDTWEGIEIDGKPYSVHISFFDTDLGFDDWYTERCIAEIFAVEELDTVDEHGNHYHQVDTFAEIQIRIYFDGVDPHELFAELSAPTPEPENADRVATVDRILGNPDWHTYMDGGHGEFLIDVLTNLRHWAKAMGVDFDEAVERSEGHFVAEI